MPAKRNMYEIPAPEHLEEPPAMSTRSKRARTVTPPDPQHQSIAKSIEAEESSDTKTTSGTLKRARRSKKKAAIAAEQSMPSPSLTPSPTPSIEVEQPLPPKKKMTRVRNTAKVVFPSAVISDTDNALAPSLMPPSNSTPPKSQQQRASKQETTGNRTLSTAFFSQYTHLSSDSTLALSPTPPPAEQQQPRTKKQKMNPKRMIANLVFPDSVEPDSDRDLAPSLTAVRSGQQERRTTKQETTRKRTAKAVSPDSAIPDSSKTLAPSLPAARSEQQEPRTTKQKATRKRAPSPIASSQAEDTALLSLAERVVKFWMDECRKVFLEKDGYEVTIHSLGDAGDQSKQQVFVWEKELYDEALLSGPSLRIPPSKHDPIDEFKLPEPSMKSADGSRTWTEKDCDFLQTGTIQPPATMQEYTRAATKFDKEFELRDIPILVIECRGADADHDYEWGNPSSNGLSRSYAPRPQSHIQKALIEKFYTFDDVKVKYEPTKGWLTQEQCFCATAIGDKIKFWKHVSPYPHLKPWSGVLNKAADEEVFSNLVSKKLAEVREDGFEFAMEWDGRQTFANA